MAEIWAGDAREARDAPGRTGILDGGPALDRTPVVPREVDPGGVHGVEDGEKVIDKGPERVGGCGSVDPGPPGIAGVIRDDVVRRGEFPDHLQEHAVVIRVPMHQQQ